MAKFVYYWKGSDNVRHEGEIDAANRDAAFAALRAQGIHAIKVEPKGWESGTGRTVGLKRWIAGICAMLLVGIAVGIGVQQFAQKTIAVYESKNRYRPETREQFDRLLKQSENLRSDHKKAMGTLRLERTRNYALIENSRDISPILAQIEKGQDLVRYSRTRVADLFRDILDRFPEESANERLDAQKIYGSLMEELDLDEYNLSCAFMAVTLLDENRGKWKEENGKVNWQEKGLADEFARYDGAVDASTARWKRDFTTIESPPVAIPDK